MSSGTHEARLLPWSTPEGKPCYLDGDGTGYISRVADTIESVQLGLAGDLLAHADDLLAEDGTAPEQLRLVLTQMTEALRDVRRIAESRGARLPSAHAALLEDTLLEDAPHDDGQLDDGPLNDGPFDDGAELRPPAEAYE